MFSNWWSRMIVQESTWMECCVILNLSLVCHWPNNIAVSAVSMSLYPRYQHLHPHVAGRVRHYYNDPFDILFDPLNDFSLIPTQIMNELQSFPVLKDSNKSFGPLLAADLVESDNDFHIHVDLPGKYITSYIWWYNALSGGYVCVSLIIMWLFDIGVSKEDLDLSFDEGVMTLKAERKEIRESNSVFHTVSSPYVMVIMIMMVTCTTSMNDD